MAPPPSQTENDPVIATFNLYLSPQPPKDEPSRFLLIQYPDRNGRRPYGPSTHQTPLSFRLKPGTGLVELDIPIDTAQNYNRARGAMYADALQRSRIISAGGSHGLAGGFNTGLGGRIFRQHEDGDVDVDQTTPYADPERQPELKIQTLGGRIAKASDGDPVYMLGSFRGSELHLTPLDSLVQVRPQLHHLDATEEVSRASLKPPRKGEQPEKSTGPETRAVELKVKTAEEKNADRARKRSNADLLSEIQSEPWQNYTWHDASAPETSSRFSQTIYHSRSLSSIEDTTPFVSAINPTTYLDSISAPRIDLTAQQLSHHTASSRSHLGLMGKVRGRERERRRRKKNDADRRAAVAEAEEATRRATSEAVDRGEMRAEEAAKIIRQASQEAAAKAGAEDSSDDGSDSSTGDEDDAAAEEDGATLLIDRRASVISGSSRPRLSVGESPDRLLLGSSARQQQGLPKQEPPKRGPGRPKKSDGGQGKTEPIIIEN